MRLVSLTLTLWPQGISFLLPPLPFPTPPTPTYFFRTAEAWKPLSEPADLDFVVSA